MFKKSALYVGGVFLFVNLVVNPSANAVTVTQQVLAPQTIVNSIKNSNNKTFSFASSANTGVLQIQAGNGSDLRTVKCSGSFSVRLSCVFSNVAKTLEVLFTRPRSLQAKINGTNVINTWDPAIGKYSYNIPLILGQNQIQVLSKGFYGSSVVIQVNTVVEDQPPQPVLTASPLQGFAPLTISASGAGSTDPDSSQLSYSWDFGDGTSAIGILANHIYTVAGNYTLTLTVTDNLGVSAATSQIITVIQDQAPLAKLSLASSGTGLGPLMVYFDGSGSSDPDLGQALTYHWDFGDGAQAEGAALITHEFKNIGSYTVRLTVQDPYGLSSSAEVSVSVIAPELPPDPITVAPALAQNNPTQTFNDQVSFLYSGNNPVQTNVDQAQMDPARVLVVKGKVFDENNQPLSGVKVEVLNEGQFGQTLTRDDGSYDFAFNKGGNLTLQFTRNGYLKAQRDFSQNAQDYFLIPDVLLKSLDPKVTTVNLNSSLAQVAQGSNQTDSDGSRTGVIIIPANTTAQLIMPDGSTRSVNSLNIRATEFTVGDNGQKKMPATLPPRSAYTYAAELSADEAIALGAKSIQFNKPVPYYVDNFLNIPVGIAVPLGVYDYSIGAWRGEKDGIVMKILAIANGIAQVDLGSGQAASQAELDYFNFTTEELQKLAELYPTGKTLWRIAMNHFTSVDLNFLLATLSGFTKINPEEPDKSDSCPKPFAKKSEQIMGCIINARRQILAETLEIPGSAFSLNYSTDRVKGRKTSQLINLGLTNDSVPIDLLRIEVDLSIAGRIFNYQYGPLPNLNFSFVWDGKDAYGRLVDVSTNAKLKVRFYYKTTYSIYSIDPNVPATFDIFGFGTVSTIPGRGEIFLEKTINQSMKLGNIIQNHVANEAGLWTLSNHHVYDPETKTLYFGSGGGMSAESLPKKVTTLFGSGKGFAGDNQLGSNSITKFNGPNNYSQGPDGSHYIADSLNNRIRKIDVNGLITTIAGTGVLGFSGDGGLATAANINNPAGVTADRAGNVYFNDRGNNRVRKIDSNGMISTIIGTGVAGYSGDGGLAVNAQINGPRSIRLSDDGSTYISDSGNNAIRRITPDGIIHTYAGNGTAGYSGDNGSALLAQLKNPNFTAQDQQGNFYIADTGNNVIRVVSPSGIIKTIAGTGVAGFSGDNGPATSAQLNGVTDLTVTGIGELLIADAGNNRIRFVDQSGVISTILGTGVPTFNGDRNSLNTNINNPIAVYFDATDRSIVVVDKGNNRIRRLSTVDPGSLASNTYQVPSADGSEIYFFDVYGRHLTTYFGKTGAIKYQFNYDNQGRFISVQDANQNTTSLVRDSSGNLSQIISPYGQITQIGLDQNGYLNRLTDPLGNSYQITYSADGLMTSFQKPKGNNSAYEFDFAGRLTKDTNPQGGVQTFNTNIDGSVAYTTATGEVSKFLNSVQFNHDRTSWTQTDSAGLATSIVRSSNIDSTSNADGSVLNSTIVSDQRLPGFTAYSSRSTFFSGPAVGSSNAFDTRSYVLRSLFDFDQTDVITEDTRQTTISYKSATHTTVSTTSLGRSVASQIDLQERPISSQLGNFNPVQLQYDSKGRLAKTIQADRVTQMSYDSAGNLAQVIDSLGRIFSFGYDLNNRMISEIRPDGSIVLHGYDANSNPSSITPPQRTAHNLDFGLFDLFSVYKAPAIGSDDTFVSNFVYDNSRKLASTQRPDGKTISYLYEASSGRYLGAQSGLSSESLSYIPGMPQVGQRNSSDNVQISYSYSGPLLSTKSYSGEVQGVLQNSYAQAGLLLTAQAINGDALSLSYDSDKLLTQVGALTLGRDTASGFVSSTQLGNFNEAYGYSTFGELTQRVIQYAGTEFYKELYTRDSLGRIIFKTESLQGLPTQYEYSYDIAGRLSDVKLNGALRTHYDYDQQGNRLNQGAQYDAQDRLTQYGSTQYFYTRAGDLESKLNNQNGATTSYSFDVFGQLKSVLLPDGTRVDYLSDGEQKRVVNKVNSTVVRKFLYDDSGRLTAELDSSNQVLARFIYATQGHSPDYMLKSGVSYKFIKDQIGSVRFVVNTNDGVTAQRVDYDEFGQVLQDTNPGFQPFGFAGGLYDPDTKLVRFGAREYDAETGRWLQKDPIGFGGGDTNLFGYCGNDPVNFVDPSGKSLAGVIAVIVVGSILGNYLFDYYIKTPEEKRADKFKKEIQSIHDQLEPKQCPINGSSDPTGHKPSKPNFFKPFPPRGYPRYPVSGEAS